MHDLKTPITAVKGYCEGIMDLGDDVQAVIEDNGKGISPKDIGNIFDRFYRTDSSRHSGQGGSGIGLSIVRKIMELLFMTIRENCNG